jgi:hypothetical protein
VLREGFSSLQTEMRAPHPVAALQERSQAAEWRLKLDAVRRTHGAHLAMRLATERAIFSQPLRLPGLPSSRVAFETITGDDTTVEFADYLDGTLPNRALELAKLRADELTVDVSCVWLQQTHRCGQRSQRSRCTRRWKSSWA